MIEVEPYRYYPKVRILCDTPKEAADVVRAILEQVKLPDAAPNAKEKA